MTAIRDAVATLCQQIGRRVAVVVNYDAFRLDPEVADAYAEMVQSLEDAFYTRVSRYTTSAFMRVKLGQILTRTVRPHIFESKSEAQAFHEKYLRGNLITRLLHNEPIDCSVVDKFCFLLVLDGQT